MGRMAECAWLGEYAIWTLKNVVWRLDYSHVIQIFVLRGGFHKAQKRLYWHLFSYRICSALLLRIGKNQMAGRWNNIKWQLSIARGNLLCVRIYLNGHQLYPVIMLSIPLIAAQYQIHGVKRAREHMCFCLCVCVFVCVCVLCSHICLLGV